MDNLMVDKKLPPAKLAQAVCVGAALVGVAIFALSTVTEELETHFHIFHPKTASATTSSTPPSGTLLVTLIALYPLVTIVTLTLVIPLLIFCADHTPFQSLNPARPDQFLRIVVRVYSAWISNPGGKLKVKDM